ncbi:unnamed protein product [Discosporangium mesarthrocarpum]
MPSPQLSELPLKSFYRLVFGGKRSSPEAVFQSLPRGHILTQRVETPEPWNVQSSWALQDTDNLRCDAFSCGDDGTLVTRSEYMLKGLLVTGRCYDVTSRRSGMSPQGLQLVLERGGAGAGSIGKTDTVVMKNLGYFQLKAVPGVWDLSLAEGRASDLYELVDPAPRGRGAWGEDPSVPTLGENLRLLRGDEDMVRSLPIVVRDFYIRH